MSVIIQVWSAPSCQSGAVCLGSLARWSQAAGSEATGSPASFALTVPRQDAVDAGVADGTCLRVLSQARGEQWWFVGEIQDADGPTSTMLTITAGPLRQLLTLRGLVRDGRTFAFTPGRRTELDLVTSYVLSNLTADNLTWLSAGTLDASALIEVGTLSATTRAGVLDAIERATGKTAVLRAVTASGVLTGFAVDLIADLGAGLDTIPLSVGAQVTSVTRTRDALRAATVLVPFDASWQPMQQTVWLVDSISGTSPAWVVLRDLLTGNPWPIREDGQVVNAYLEQRDGTRTQITDARASDGAVKIGSVGTVTVGDEVTLVASTAGDAITEVTTPSGVTSARGRLVGTLATDVTDARRNLVRNGALRTWSTDTSPAHWTGAGVVARYDRTASLTDASLVVDGNQPNPTTSVPFRGGTAGARYYRSEWITIAGANGRIEDAVVTVDSNGKGTFTFATGWAGGLTDGDAITVKIGSQGPARPSAFPSDPLASAVARLVTASGVISSASAKVTVSSTPVTVAAAVGLTITRDGAAASSSTYPSLQLRSTAGAGSTLSSASVTAIPAVNTTAHQTLSCSATLSSTDTVLARVTAGANNSSGYLHWQGIRWLSLWVGGDPVMTMQDGSGSNGLWHRAQDVLRTQATGMRYVVTGVDLDRLLNETGPPQLGQRCRIRSDRLGIDVTAQIVKLDYDFRRREALAIEAGVIVPRLTAATVEL